MLIPVVQHVVSTKYICQRIIIRQWNGSVGHKVLLKSVNNKTDTYEAGQWVKLEIHCLTESDKMSTYRLKTL